MAENLHFTAYVIQCVYWGVNLESCECRKQK